MGPLEKLIMFAHMRHDTVEQVKAVVPAVAGTGITWGIHEWSQSVSLGVGVFTGLYILVQMLFLLRKWYKLELANWRNNSSGD